MEGFFGIGFQELVMIAVVALIVLGPERLPATLREVAKFIRQIRNLTTEFTQQFGDDFKALEDLDPRRMLQQAINSIDEEEQAKEGTAKGATAAAKTTAAKTTTPAKATTAKTTTSSTASTNTANKSTPAKPVVATAGKSTPVPKAVVADSKPKADTPVDSTTPVADQPATELASTASPATEPRILPPAVEHKTADKLAEQNATPASAPPVEPQVEPKREANGTSNEPHKPTALDTGILSSSEGTGAVSLTNGNQDHSPA